MVHSGGVILKWHWNRFVLFFFLVRLESVDDAWKLCCRVEASRKILPRGKHLHSKASHPSSIPAKVIVKNNDYPIIAQESRVGETFTQVAGWLARVGNYPMLI